MVRRGVGFTVITYLADTADQVERGLEECVPAVEEAALACEDAASALFVGRGMRAVTSYGGAPELREIGYPHTEAYAVGTPPSASPTCWIIETRG